MVAGSRSSPTKPKKETIFGSSVNNQVFFFPFWLMLGLFKYFKHRFLNSSAISDCVRNLSFTFL